MIAQYCYFTGLALCYDLYQNCHPLYPIFVGVHDFHFSLRARPYHRMKLMLVGYAARGKTTLLQKISEKGQRGVQENWALQRFAYNMHYFVVLSSWSSMF